LVAVVPSRLLQLVQGYMNLKLGVDKVYAEMEEDYEDCVPEVSLEEAINIIQRNERGRQGKARAMLVKRVRESEKRDRCSRCFWEWFVRVFHQLLWCFCSKLFDGNSEIPSYLAKNKDEAASDIQKVFRGFVARRRAAIAREEELVRPPA
jgi:IQ and AAA domain-containing protein